MVTDYSDASGTILYAHWTPVTYMIDWVSDAVTVRSDEVTVEQELPTAPDLTKDGYTLTWDTSVSLADLTITAIWTPIDYTISYDLNYAGAAAPTEASWTYDTTFTIAADAERTHYTFDGWFDAADGGSEVTDYSDASDTILYAHWTPIEPSPSPSP